MDEPAGGAHRRPLLLGHRGCRGDVPENTIAAFDYAMACGCDGFEFDLRLTVDHRAIICHDARLRGRAVAKASYTELLNKHARSLRFIRNRRQGDVCCLDDVLLRYGRKAFLYIEVKVAGAEEIAIDALRSNPARHYVIASFLPTVVRRVHEIAPEIPVGFIFDNLAGLRRWRELPVTHVMPHYRFVTQRRVAAMHETGKQVITWTVNSAKKMRQLAEWGIDGVVSDDPLLLSNTLGGYSRLTT